MIHVQTELPPMNTLVIGHFNDVKMLVKLVAIDENHQLAGEFVWANQSGKQIAFFKEFLVNHWEPIIPS